MIETGIVFIPHPAQQAYFGQSVKKLRDRYVNLTDTGAIYATPNSFYVDMYTTPTYTIILKNARIFKHVDHTRKYFINDSLSNSYHKNYIDKSNYVDITTSQQYLKYSGIFSENLIFYDTATNVILWNYNSPNNSKSDNENEDCTIETTFNQGLNQYFDPVIKPPNEIKKDLKKIWTDEIADTNKSMELKNGNETSSSYASVVKKRSGNFKE